MNFLVVQGMFQRHLSSELPRGLEHHNDGKRSNQAKDQKYKTEERFVVGIAPWDEVLLL